MPKPRIYKTHRRNRNKPKRYAKQHNQHRALLILQNPNRLRIHISSTEPKPRLPKRILRLHVHPHHKRNHNQQNNTPNPLRPLRLALLFPNLRSSLRTNRKLRLLNQRIQHLPRRHSLRPIPEQHHIFLNLIIPQPSFLNSYLFFHCRNI